MLLYPAIDLIDGKCVRLYQGDFGIQKTYSGSPLDIAKGYTKSGAEWIHVVDLDGARDPLKRQIDMIQSLVSQSGAKIQSGGGVRALKDIELLLAQGVKRVVIGSMAVREPAMVRDALKTYGAEAICVAVDVKPRLQNADQYDVAIAGWKEDSKIEIRELLKQFDGAGLKHVLCTDISRDGTLSGSNISLYRALKREFPALEIQASGGVGTLEDLIHLHDARVDGAIVGKALYEGKFTVEDALQVVKC